MPKALSRDERAACWKARDAYFNCVENPALFKHKGDNPCAEARKQFEEACPKSWVDHFIRGREGQRYREMIRERGFQPLPDDEASQ